MAKDRRSKADKQKDEVLDSLHQRIEHMEAVVKERKRDIERDEMMIAVLKDQVADINTICGAQKKETEEGL